MSGLGAMLTHGDPQTVAELLDDIELSSDMRELRAAMINAMTRIAYLENQVQRLTTRTEGTLL